MNKLDEYQPGQWWLEKLANLWGQDAPIDADTRRAAKVACDFAALVFAARSTHVVPAPEQADPDARLVVAVSTIEPGATVIVSLVQPGRMTMLYSEHHPAGMDSGGNMPLPAGLFAAPADVDARIDAEMSTHQARQPVRGNFFPHVPLLTDKQDNEARAGTCPSCHIEGLVDVGTGEGLRFLGCVACTAVVVLASRPGDRPLMRMTGRHFGRTHLAQQVKLAMTEWDTRHDGAAGACAKGRDCVCAPTGTACGRDGCIHWRNT